MSSAYLSYTGGMPSRKIRPIVQIDTNGDLKTTMEVKQNKSDFNRNAPLDKYFNNTKVDKLLYDTRKEQKRRLQI